MGYIFALLSVLSGNIKGYCGKQVSNLTEKTGDAMLFNCLRMFFCIIIAFVLIAAQGNVSLLKINGTFFGISVLSGVFTAVFVVTWLLSVKGSAYMLVEIFVMFATVVPLTLGYIVYGEDISFLQICGVAMLFVSVIIMCSYNRSLKSEKIGLKSWVLLILCMLSCGMSDFSQKMFTKTVADGSAAVFNFYTYIVSAAVLFVFFMIFGRKESANADNIKKGFGYMFLMAIFLFGNSYFKTKAAVYLSSVRLYPLTSSLALTGSTLMSALFFKEKLTAKCICGILISLAAIIIISIA